MTQPPRDLPPAAPAAAPSTVDEVGATGPHITPPKARVSRMEAPLEVPGYAIDGVLGRGGMGVVYKALHLSLKRTVALKMILAGGHAGDEERARFKAEAEAVARLQHPHIVQIHEVGEHDGRPYCALEFVEGGSLAQKLAGNPLPATDAARLVQTLAAAVQVAHSRNVVHRDLKPANVLLTADGAPKVTDFGLAKLLDESGQTQSGAIMGTPSYMAPEQAEGKNDVGPAADVYALGAILYECLTGRPPFKAATTLDTLLQVVADEPAPPRQLNPQVPQDVETICLKCLRKEPAQRYPAAEALADDLRLWQAGEPIKARPVGPGERAVKWVRRRPLVAALSAAVVATVLMGASVSLAFGLHARQKAMEANKALQEAEANLTLAQDAVNECFNVAKDHPLFQTPRMEKARKLLLAKTLPFYQQFRWRRPDDRGLLQDEGTQLSQVAYIELVLGRPDESLRAYEQARALLTQLAQAHPDKPEYLKKLAHVRHNLAAALSSQGKRDLAIQELEQACDLQRKLVEQSPDQPANRHDLARTLSNLGVTLAFLGKRSAARAEYEQARDLMIQVVKEQPDMARHQTLLASVRNNLGSLLKDLGKHDAAMTEHEHALDLLSGLVKSHPNNPSYQEALGHTHGSRALLLEHLGNHKAAAQEYQLARDTFAKLAETHPDVPTYPNALAGMHTNLGSLLFQLRKSEAALKEYEQAMIVQARLAKEYPGLPRYRHNLASTHHNLAKQLTVLGRLTDALKQHQQAEDLQTRLVKDHPEEPEYQNHLGRTHYNRGIVLAHQGKFPEALNEYAQALDIQHRLVKDHPDAPLFRADMGTTYINRGQAYRDLGMPDRAVQSLQDANEAFGRIARRHPDVPEYQCSAATTRLTLAQAFADLGRSKEALGEYQQARDTFAKLADSDPRSPEYPHGLAVVYHGLALLRVGLGKQEEALKDYRKARDFAENVAKEHSDCSFAEESAGYPVLAARPV
jgi:serine/threonine-protein kinase